MKFPRSVAVAAVVLSIGATARPSGRTIYPDPGQARADVAAAIDRTVAWIGKHPNAAPIVFGGNVRAKLVGRYQYRVFYSVEESELIVRNVRSTKRRLP